MKNVSFRMADEKVSELDEDADELGLSRAEYIRTLIESRHEHLCTFDLQALQCFVCLYGYLCVCVPINCLRRWVVTWSCPDYKNSNTE